MARIYIDTNVFLDFYQAATDRLAAFHELVDKAANVVLSEQTIREFRRNRSARLSNLAREIESAKPGSVFTTAVVQEIPAFKEWVKAREQAKECAKAISQQLLAWLHDEKSDPVLAEFEKLIAKASVFATTPQAVDRAKLRKALGEPPTSPDKHTIGDELIWETILEQCKQDLILVSRDRTFLDNADLLKKEFEAAGNRRLVKVTASLREAFKDIGETAARIAKAEESIEAHHAAKEAIETGNCPKCHTEMEEDGYEGSDGDEAWWLYCPKCAHQIFPV